MLMDTINISSSNDIDSLEGSSSMDPGASSPERRLSTLRYRLAPLVAAESSLADRLCGDQPSPDKANLLLRSGWQSRSLFSKSKTKERSSFTGQRSSLENVPARKSEDSSTLVGSEKDKLIEEVAAMLNACKEDIKELWEHPTVNQLRDRRRLRLEEWAE